MLEILEGFFKLLAAIIGLGILVFFHELGHFIFAVLFKIKVEKFSIGMGPPIYGFKRGDTFFQIGAVPFGGFCKFKGDEITDDQTKSKDPDSFYSAPPVKRLFVAFAGPFMNYVIAILFLAILAMWAHKEIYFPNEILLVDDVLPIKNNEKNPATLAGLLTHDIIVQIDDTKVSTFDEIHEYFLMHQQKKYKVHIKRGNESLIKQINAKWDPEQLKYVIGIYYFQKPIIQENPENKLHNVVGFQPGDKIVGIDDDYEFISTIKVDYFIRTNFSRNKISTFHVERNGEVIDIPVDFNILSRELTEQERRLSFLYPYRTIEGKNVGQSVIHAVKESYKIVRISLIGIYSLIFKPKKNVSKQFGGPIIIGYMIGEITVQGFKENFFIGLKEFFSTISYISLILAIFNLLPIPALDGGHIIMNIYELITRRPLNLKIIYIVNFVFFVIIIILALFVAYLDITKIAGSSPF